MSTEQTTTDPYRRVLALLPRAYREQRGEEMLAVMLDAAESEGRRGPTIGELLSVLGLSLRLRTGAPGSSPRAQSVGETLRLITLIGLLHQAVAFAATPAGLLRLWLHPDPGFSYAQSLGEYDNVHLVSSLCAFVCPFFALAALILGKRGLGLILTTNAVILPSISYVMFIGSARFTMEWGNVLELCAIPTITGLLGFHRDAPRVPRPRLRLWFTAALLITIPLIVINAMPVQSRHWTMMWNVFIIACGCAAVGVALSRASRGVAWPAALMVAGAPLLLALPYVTPASFEALLTDPYSNSCIALSGLGVEVLLALILAVSLTRRLRTASAGAAGS